MKTYTYGFHETTPNHGFYGPEKGCMMQIGQEERGERERESLNIQPLVFFILEGQKAFVRHS